MTARLLAQTAAAVLAAAVAAAAAGLPAQADTRIVAATADLAALATAILGDPAATRGPISVETIVPPGADAEAYEPHPRDIEKLRRADIVVRVGLGYDYWLDRLLVEVANPRLMRGGEGYVDGSVGIPLLEVRGGNVVNDGGHVHGVGNPHYWLDPQNAAIVTGGIAEALIRLLPGARESVTDRRKAFLAALETRMAAWRERAEPFAGARLFAYHNAWPYFARRFRLDLVDFIEPKPGIAPSPAHLAHLLTEGRQKGVRAVLQEPYEPDDTSRFVAARLGIPVVTLAPSVGTLPGTKDYLDLFDADIALLAKALGEGQP